MNPGAGVLETGLTNANNQTRSVQRAVTVLALYLCTLVMLLFVAWCTRERLMTVVGRPQVADVDNRVLQLARSRSTPLTDMVFVCISWAGSPVAVLLWAIAGVLWLMNRKRFSIAALWIATVGGSGALSVSLKHIFRRARPPGATEFLHALSFGFPSTHTVASLVAYSTVCYMLCRFVLGVPWQRVVAVAVTVAFVACIAASRVVLGVHYFSDVCAGLVVGLVWLSVCLGGLEFERRMYAIGVPETNMARTSKPEKVPGHAPVG